EKRLGPWQALEVMQAKIAESEAGGLRGADRVAGRVRKHDLPAVGGRADPSRGVHSDPYVSRVGQGGMPSVKPDSDPYVQVVRPNPRGNLALNRERGTQRCRGLFEDGEHLVGSGVDLPAARLQDGAAEQAADIGQQPRVPGAGAADEAGRALDGRDEQ